jgi:tape measure domain-containing protein
MAAQQLNVRVGLLFDEKSLANIERQMRSSGQRLSRIGTDLSLSLSLPLAAFGATAIKSAGDIESLTLALKSQLGTADAAAKELEKLTEAAKNPGLGVEQAVRGSIRLQGVGFAAEEARNVLIQMGNAIAATGGSAEELDSVTRQFAQMTSKGRVLQEDVSVLSENMPGLAQLMQKAFGTANVEAIRNMGISGKEFVTQITKAAEALPRVEGGIKNGIGNAIDSLKQSAAKVGFAINEAFDVTGLIESVSSAVLYLAQGFASLDPWVKKTVLGIAGIAIATGPLIKAWGAIQLLGSQMVSLWGGIVGAANYVVSGLQAIRTAFLALSAATQAFILIGVTVALISLISAFSSYSSQLSNAEKAQVSLTAVNQKAADSISGQKSEVDTLVAAYKTEGATLEQKKAILDQLNKISPEYFGAIKAGKGDVEALTIATSRYSAELLKVAQITAAKDRLVEIEKAILSLNKSSEPSLLQTFGNILLSNGNAAKFAGDQVSSFTGNVNSAKAALVAERDAMVGLIAQSTLADAATGKLGESQKSLAKAVKDTAKAVEEAKTPQLSTSNLPATSSGVTSQASPISPEVPALLDATIARLSLYSEAAAYASEIQQQLTEGTFNFQTGLAAVSTALLEQGNLVGGVFAAMGDAIAQSAAQGETSFAKLGQAAAGAAAKIIRAYIQQGVAAAVAKALSSFPFPLNIAAGAAAGGLAAALFTKAVGAIGVKGFARGTSNAPGGVALVGEQGPELINLPRGSQVFPTPQTNQMLSNMGGAMVLSGELRASGSDLVALVEMTQAKNQRFR